MYIDRLKDIRQNLKTCSNDDVPAVIDAERDLLREIAGRPAIGISDVCAKIVVLADLLAREDWPDEWPGIARSIADDLARHPHF